MYARITGIKVEVSSDTLMQIERAFENALDRFTHVVRDAEVTLLAVHGPKDGVDKRCRVQLRLYPSGFVVVRSSTTTSFLDAVHDACDKTRAIIARKLGKRRTLFRNNGYVM